MRAVGMLTTIVVSLGAAVAAVVGIRSVPDIKRYLRIRNM